MTRHAATSRRLGAGLLATLPAWLVAHLVVLLVCRQISPGDVLGPLYVWDTHWYLAEADGMAHGTAVFTDQTGAGGLAHFFPLTSLATAGLTVVTRLPTAFVLFAFSWTMSLLFGALVYLIALTETEDEGTARRAAWLSQLAPGAFVLVMGYTEPLAGVLAAGYFLAVRRGRPGWAVALGLLAGVSRPTGVVLALFGLIEAIRRAYRSDWRPRSILSGLAQAAAPLIGLGGYLLYCQLHFGDWILPYAQQVTGGNRGSVAQNPLGTFQYLAQSGYPYGGQILLTSAICALIALAGLIACLLKLPISYTAWSAVMFWLGITSPLFTSEPRYLAALFPLLIALAVVARRWWQWYPLLALNTGMLAWVAWLALSWHQVA
ncbi:hypothetical protein [Actinospica robiniae]|uniref:hypothetical protein n=1 Tax=Actinospica robiniae TaxID=304901 RepID=UPI0004266FF7|nr:hypothetical protein [Actinospica robiniae]